MERKNTQSVIITFAIVMAMVCVSYAAERELIAVGACISNCVSRCNRSPNYDRCYNGCAGGCVPALNTEASTPSSFYCNLGCSLHKCGNIADDANKLESCLDDCSKVQCKA